MMKQGKLLIFSAPSGSGKTTIVKHLIEKFPQLEFSVSACTRTRRPNEIDGRDYYFLNTENFKEKISKNEFIEYEEVYEGNFYGTLKSELERIWSHDRHVLFDLDVKGGLNMKKLFGPNAMAVFVKPPSIEILIERLKQRSTESEYHLNERLRKVNYELTFEPAFDKVIINDELHHAFEQAENIVKEFLELE